MNQKRSMRIFWISLCLLLVSGAVIIAAAQYKSHKKKEAERLGRAEEARAQELVTPEAETTPAKENVMDVQRSGGNALQGESEESGYTKPAGSAAAEFKFQLNVMNGYLDVYHYQTKELYFHTGIPYSTLTAGQKQELQEGKYFYSEQDLYGYLESCTS